MGRDFDFDYDQVYKEMETDAHADSRKDLEQKREEMRRRWNQDGIIVEIDTKDVKLDENGKPYFKAKRIIKRKD